MEKSTIKVKISCVLAVLNEEKNLVRCLDSVFDWVSEIIIVDGGSTDNTLEISKKYHAKIIKTDNPPIFHINKQKALEAAKYDWILQLDADEVVSLELKDEIIQTIQQFNNVTIKNNVNGFYIPRKNIFWGHWMRKGGQYPDYVIRLVRNKKAKFPCLSVHEQIDVQGNIGYLTSSLIHYAYNTVEDYWRKADIYTTLTARTMKSNINKGNLVGFINYMIIKPGITFFNIYIRHKGFMDGWIGLRFSYYSALHWIISYNKMKKMV
jgi:glycosyltransferase involved in cell wall biosynthesis